MSPSATRGPVRAPGWALAWFALNGRRTGELWKNGGGPAFVTCIHSPTEWIAQWNRTPLNGRRDTELVWMERDAAAIRMRAERQLGEMMAAQKRTVGNAKGGHSRNDQ